MTRYILALFIIVMVSRAAQAGCYDNLSQGRDSNYYQISSNALTTESSLVEKTTREALKLLLQSSECTDVSIQTFNCKNIQKQQEESRTCYARTDIGYFVLNKDYLGNVNIIFSRFD